MEEGPARGCLWISAFVTRALMGHFSSEAGSADVFPTPQPASSLGAGGRGGAACLIFRVRTRSEDHVHLGVGVERTGGLKADCAGILGALCPWGDRSGREAQTGAMPARCS